MAYKIVDMWLTPNEYSRPRTKLKALKGIIVHWVANPMTTAKQNIKFFENRKLGQTGYGSAHELIDLDGSVWRCLPDDEMSYHVGSKTYPKEAIAKFGSYPNSTTYGIECTHIDWNGKMTDATYASLVERVADLCKEHNLNPLTDVWLHKEVVGWKNCHLWFVNNPNEWAGFKLKVNDLVKGIKSAAEPVVAPKPSETKLEEAMSMKMSDFIPEGDMIRLETVYRYARADKFLSDDTWEKKCKDKSITVGEVAYLDALLDHRRYGETKKKFAEYESKVAELESKLK